EAVGHNGFIGVFKVLRLFALSMILHDHLRPQLHHLIRDLPQMAYLEGGVLLSVDLKQAFDVMPRERLQEAMQLANVDHAAQYVILKLHEHACLRIAHGHKQATLETSNGIRQGCCLAPALWVLYTGLILTYLRQRIAMQDTTVYADDFLFHWLVQNGAQLEQAFENIAFVLCTLDHFGMRPSPTKSAVLIGVRGTRTHTVLSYGQFESLTLKERLKQSWSAFNRLVPALRSSGISLQHRTGIWRTCVHSVLMHGLDSIGLSPGGATKLQKHVARQLRILSKAPSFITHEPTPDLYARLQVEEPVQPSNMDLSPDALREGARAVAEQELMSAEAQASLLSSMMNKGPAPSTPPGPTDSGLPSAPSTRAPTTPTQAPGEAVETPEPMDSAQRETKRQAEVTEEDLQTGNGKGRDKWQRPQSKGNSRSGEGNWGGRGRDHQPAAPRRYQQPSRQWNRDKDWDQDDREERPLDRSTEKKLFSLRLSMSRLMMRHEDQLSINRAQDNCVMFAQTQGVLSAVPELFKATEAWRQMKKDQPELLTLPLRTWMLKHWVDLMLTRMEAVMQSERSIQQAKDMLVLDDSCNVPYLERDASARQLRVKRDRDPMTLSQVLELLKQMQVLVLQPLAILRFHTTRELVQNMQSDVVPLMLQIGSRTAECHQLWNAFYRLSHSGATRVVATSLRGDRMGRSALAVAIQKMVEELSGTYNS
ncbi:unnamed protein product, partial [Symbiodinium sp. CCMP2456]